MAGGDRQKPIDNKPAVRVEYENLCPESQWRLREALRIWADWHETKIAPHDCKSFPGPPVGGSFAYMWPALYGGCVALMEVPKPSGVCAPVVVTPVNMHIEKDAIAKPVCSPAAVNCAQQTACQAGRTAQNVGTHASPRRGIAPANGGTTAGVGPAASQTAQSPQAPGGKRSQDRNASVPKAAKALNSDHQGKRRRQEKAAAPVVKLEDGTSGESVQTAQGVVVKEDREEGELEEGEIVEKKASSSKGEARKRQRCDQPVRVPEVKRDPGLNIINAGPGSSRQQPQPRSRKVDHNFVASATLPSSTPTTSEAETNNYTTGSFFPVASSGHASQIYSAEPQSQPHPTANLHAEPLQQSPHQHFPHTPHNVIVQGPQVLPDADKPRFAVVGPAMGPVAQRPLMVDQQINQQPLVGQHPLIGQQPLVINQGINQPPLIVRPVQHPPQQNQPGIFTGASPSVGTPGNQPLMGLQQPILMPQLGLQQVPGQLNPLQPRQPVQHNVLNFQQMQPFGGLQAPSQGGQGPAGPGQAPPIQGLNVVPGQYQFFQ